MRFKTCTKIVTVINKRYLFKNFLCATGYHKASRLIDGDIFYGANDHFSFSVNYFLKSCIIVVNTIYFLALLARV